MADYTCPIVDIANRPISTGTVTSTGITPTDENPITTILSLAFIIQLIMLIIVLVIIYFLLKYAKII